MRLSLVLVAAGAVAVGVACAAVTRLENAGAQEPPGDTPTVRKDLDHDLEVMRRLLAREGLGVGSGSREVWHVYWPTSDRTVEVFHVQGDGALFLLRTSDAVAPPPNAMTEESGDKPPPSAWDQVADELAGRPRTAVAVQKSGEVRAVYDAAKVDALRARILAVLAENGHRIRGLGPGDHLTVLVAGGNPASPLAGALVSPTTVHVGTNEGIVKLIDAAAGRLTVRADGSISQRTTLTIRVSAEDCRRAAKGDLALEEFRRRAVIAAY